MKQTAQLLSGIEPRNFVPLDKLSAADAQELLRTSISMQLSPSTPVFSQDDMDRQVFYLLRGKIEVLGAGKKTIIEGGSPEARKPIGRHLPGQASARALEESVLISFDADMLDLFLNWTNPNAYVVNEMETGKDHEWINRLLQSRGLLRFSEPQISTLLERMNEVHFKAGQTVVTQDSNDDFYYVIKEGRATVSRRPDAAARPIKLAELHAGDAFGEESLLTSSARAATVTMQEDGTLMRLSKKDFAELLAAPLLNTITWDEARAMAATGGVFIDIRLQEAFKAMSIPGSVNIPLPVLRLKLKRLKHNRKYILYCDDGSRSSVAAFLLNRHGFDAFILDGGLAGAAPYLACRQMGSSQTAATAQPDKSDAPSTTEDNRHTRGTHEQVLSQTTQGNAYCSLADYWGATVDEVSDDSFTDSNAVYQIEKTRATDVKTKPPRITEIKRPAAKPVPHKPATPTPTANPYGSNPLLRTTLIGVIAVGLAGLFAVNSFTLEKPAQLVSPPPTVEVTMPAAQAAVPAPSSSRNGPVPLPEVAGNRIPIDDPRLPFNDGAQNDTLIESDIQLSMDGEILPLQATTITPEVEALEMATPPEKLTLDPATRGFLE